ncbi:MAG: glycosyltransferase family 2 protein [Opitutae bacterium]|nr:glycosyltransferase family 2 protein [Opitutae bacterium]
MSPESQNKLPITAIFPTYNCGGRIRQHIEQSASWLKHVDELIVVNSYSTDGTIDAIKEAFEGSKVTILQHPRGLYESWNHGVRAASNDYIYFSTIGDIITLDGLEKLLATAQELGSDLVVSPPSFVADGPKLDPLTGIEWPIHTLIRELQIKEPTILPARLTYDCVLIFMERALLGSSASNLYKTSALLKHPFSDEFFSAGDSQWLINNNFEIRLAVMPEVVSTYLFHQKDWSFDNSESERGYWLRCTFAYGAFNTHLDHSPSFQPEVIQLLRKIVETSVGQADEPHKGEVICIEELTGKIAQIDPQTDKYQFTIQAMLARSNYLIFRQRERKYKQQLGPIRFIWPNALINRTRKKQSKRELRGLMRTIKKSWTALNKNNV